MPLFGGSKRPKLDGLTKDEEKRRDALNPEVLRRAGEKGVAGQAPAAAALLKEKQDSEPGEYLWPLLLGWQMMSMQRFVPAIEAFTETVNRASNEIRGYYGAGIAYFEAAEAKQNQGAATGVDVAPETMTVDNLYQESMRYFRRGMELAADTSERDQLRTAVATVEKAIGRKSGRL